MNIFNSFICSIPSLVLHDDDDNADADAEDAEVYVLMMRLLMMILMAMRTLKGKNAENMCTHKVRRT